MFHAARVHMIQQWLKNNAQNKVFLVIPVCNDMRMKGNYNIINNKIVQTISSNHNKAGKIYSDENKKIKWSIVLLQASPNRIIIIR